jgi:hypothetical protein
LDITGRVTKTAAIAGPLPRLQFVLKVKPLEAAQARVWLLAPSCRVVLDPAPYFQFNNEWVGLATPEEPDIQAFEGTQEHEWRIALPVDQAQLRILEAIRDTAGDLKIGLVVLATAFHLEEGATGQAQAIQFRSEEDKNAVIIPARIPSSDWERFRPDLGYVEPKAHGSTHAFLRTLAKVPIGIYTKLAELLQHVIHRIPT